MFQVVVSPKAREDLTAIRRYIRDDPGSPEAAQRVLKRLKSGMRSLETMPLRGAPLDAVLPFHTEYRFLVCEKHLIFCTVSEARVQVLRVLHQLQNSMRLLFP